MSTTSSGQSAGQLETRGIEPVPEGECNGHPQQLFWVWFAANISIELVQLVKLSLLEEHHCVKVLFLDIPVLQHHMLSSS